MKSPQKNMPWISAAAPAFQSAAWRSGLFRGFESSALFGALKFCRTAGVFRAVGSLALTMAAVFFVPVSNAQVVWNGGGTDNNWSTGANWVGSTAPANNGTAALQFAGSTRLAPNA